MTVTDWDDLDELPETNERTKRVAAANPKIPCDHCAGTGRWSGGTNQYGNSKCHACNGRGHFHTTAVDRQQKRDQRVAKKTVSHAEAKAAYLEVEGNGDMIAALRGMVSWNDFACSLVAGFDKYGSLTEKQRAAAERMIAKVAATREAKAVAREVTVDLSPIRAMFEMAFGNGHKRPKYRAENIILSRAPDHGKNAGSIYVVDHGETYLGKITADNKFHPTHAAGTDVAEQLATIAVDPSEAAARYGHRTGSCSCCGRELTVKASIDRGIGPICATKYGF